MAIGTDAPGGDGTAAEQSATPARHQQHIQSSDFFHQFQSGGSLTGDDIFMIVGRDQSVPVSLFEVLG
jgi:hypothetical protein